jgi:hypothetical protein
MEKVAGLLAESNARKKNMVCTFYFEYTFFAFVDIQTAPHNVEAKVVEHMVAHASVPVHTLLL